MERATRLMILVAALIAAAAAPAAAQEGLYFGAEMVFADIGGQANSSRTISTGDGAGIMAGYGFDRHIAIEASVWSTDHVLSDGRKVDLEAGVLGVKATMPLEKGHIWPYVLFGIGRYTLDVRRGDGWCYGAGMDIYLPKAITLFMGITRHAIDFGPDPRTSGDVTSMTIGLSYSII